MKAGALRLLLVVAALTVLAFPASASAAPGTIVVDTTADNASTTGTGCSLRQAIASANENVAYAGCAAGLSGSVDTIDVPAGTYDLSANNGQLLISSDMSIVGAGARSTEISGSTLGQRVLEISPGNVTIDGVTIEGGNTVTGGPEPNPGVGGGIWVQSGSLTLQDSMVSDNHADQSGGGIDSDGSLTVVRSTIENNSAGCGVIRCGLGIGGGIDDFGSSLSITNSTIAANQAQADGGGLFIGSGANLVNDTIADNAADLSGAAGSGGGGIAVYGGTDPHTVFLTNTLLADNPWNGDGGSECSTGGVATLGGNLADDSSCGLTAAGDQENVNPQLGQLDSSGTTDVIPLLSGSPAIDAGDDLACPAVDQRGVSRPQGPHCDIGAYEFVPTGLISGSVSASGEQDADLTSLGTDDWAVWGFADSGTSTSLIPDVRKRGGSAISSLTDIDPTATRLRGLGQFSSAGDLPFGFDWSDGTGPASATGAPAGLEHDGQQTQTTTNGDGFSFTVPADTTERTVTVFTSEHWGTGTLTAALSDGSVQPYSQTVDSPSTFPSFGGNAPGVFTIRYRAASAGQHLTVSWVESADACPGSYCDDAAIYAVALSGGAGSASSASSSLSSDRSVPMAASNVPIADIPLYAFEPQLAGSPGLQLNGLQLNGLQLNGLQLNGLQLNGLQLNGLQLNGLQLNGLQLNGLQLNGLQLNGLQLNGLQLNGLQLNGLPLDPVKFPDGWPGVLAGTSLADQPLQTVTLEQVLALDPQPQAFQEHPLTLGDLDISGSALGQVTIGALALSGTQLNGLPTDYQTAIWDGLNDWCQSTVTNPATACGPGGTLGDLTLLQLALTGAPVQGLQLNGLQLNGLQLNGLQLNGLQLNGLQLNGLSTSASAISGLQLNGLQLNGLPLGDLQLNGLPASALDGLFDCTLIDCSTATLADAQAAGAIEPDATVGDLDPYFGDLTIGDLLESVLGPESIYASTATFGDLIGLLIHRADVPWETLSPETLSLFDKSRPRMNMTAEFTLQGSGTPAGDATVKIPDGFDYDPGSASLSEGGGQPQPIGDPTVSSDGHTLDWHFTALDVNVPYHLGFELRSGTTVGPAQATETITSGDQTSSSTASFTVTDSYQGNSDPDRAATITPDDAVQLSALPQPGAVDWYRIPTPAAGTRIHVHLTDLSADYDLALYSTATTSVRTGATDQQPLQDGVAPSQPIHLDGGSNGQLTPTALQDVPDDPGVPIVQVSANRGTDDEEVGMVSPGPAVAGNYITFAVFGYNGAFSAKPYSLRVTTQAPAPTLTCPARTFPEAGAGTTPDALPGSLPSNLNTIILVDEKRLGDTYGAAAEANAVAKLHSLASDASLGVSGVVVPVEQISGVQSLYDTWDANPCDNDAADAIANKIADEVDTIKAARPSVQYVVFAGGDDQIPFFRIPDLTLIDNESGFAAQFGANEYHGALAAGDLLSDNPYLDTRPVPASGRQLFIPDLTGGRLVESADDIANAVTSFESSNGILQSASGFVSGYDFVADGSQQVADRLSALGVNVTTLANPLSPTSTWGLTDLLNAAFPAGGSPADINDWNGHYDNTRALMANGTDLLSTSQLTGPDSLDGGIFFTMGCHAGFQTTDAVVGGTPVLDWAQYFAEHGTGFVGNTGFGYGSTDSAAFSEELMTDFAGQLGGSVTLGQALTQAKDEYFLSRVAFSSYDEKTLSEAELYGLPMYGVGRAPDSLVAAATMPSDPVTGTSQSTSPTQGTLSPFPGGAQSAGFAATPSFSPLQHGTDGDYFTNAGQVQAPDNRPLQPYISLPATRGGLVAHGVVIDSLTSQDDTPFDPDNNRPILDQSSKEPEPQFGDEAWPEKIPTLVSLDGSQSLNLITGQFFTEGDTGSGVERLWTQIDGRVTYSTSQDFTPPTIDSIDAFLGNGAVAFSGRFSDLDQNGQPGTVAFAQVVYDDGNGNWVALPLHDDGSGTWSGGAPFGGQHVQFFVEACDTAGNCGYSSNKGRYFDAQPLPSSSGTLTLTPSSPPNASSWYTTANLTVSATSSAQTVEASVDGGPFVAVSGPIDLGADGVHVVEARDSDGNTATGVYLVDTTRPTTPTFAGIAAQLYPIDDLPAPGAIGCASTDATSGLGSCVVTGYGATLGTHTLTATATDNAGNASTATLTYTVGFQGGDILAPVTAPSGDQTNPDAADLQAFQIKSVVPLKFRFNLDAAKTTLLTAPPEGSVAILTVTKHDSTTNSDTPTTVLATGGADTGNQFRWTGSPDYEYVFNMATKQLMPGTYSAQITLESVDGIVIGVSAKQYFILR